MNTIVYLVSPQETNDDLQKILVRIPCFTYYPDIISIAGMKFRIQKRYEYLITITTCDVSYDLKGKLPSFIGVRM